ncbi:MAG: hypothetical protein IT384_28500 [Deltaproteobacteria bacterium]|nr:hypothetical protein [Deltaproteobacteria bacterium]
MSLSDALIRGQRWPLPGIPSGEGVLVEGGSGVDVARVIVQDNDRAGIDIQSGSSATIRDVFLVGQRSRDPLDAGSGVGLSANGGASLEAHRLTARGNARRGVHVAASTATITDVHLSKNAQGEPDQLGLYLGGGGQLIARRVQAEGEGVMVAEQASRLVLSEASLIGAPEGPGFLFALQGSTLKATKVVITGRANPNLLLSGGNAEITDAVVAGDDGGILVEAFGQARLERMLIDGARFGLRVRGASVEGHDVVLRSTTIHGIAVESDSRATLARVKLDSTKGLGVRVKDLSQIDIQDLIEIGTATAGRGVHVDTGGRFNGSHLLIEGNEAYGLEGSPQADGFDLTDGEISRNPTALFGLVPADLSCCLVRVRYRDNGTILR